MVDERKGKRCRFGEILDKLLESREFSSRELCRLSSLAESSISHYMIGRERPSRSAIERMAKAFEVPECLLAWFSYTDENNSALFKGVEAIMQEALRYSIKDYEEIKMEI